MQQLLTTKALGRAARTFNLPLCRRHITAGNPWRHLNPLVPRVEKIKIRKLAITDFYWPNS